MKNLIAIRNTFRKSVNIIVDGDVRYFTIWQVCALNSHGLKVSLECYFDLKDAERRVKFINANCRHNYVVSYVFELKVLC